MEGFLWRVVLSAAGMHRVDRDNVHDMAWSFVRLVVCVWGVHTNVCCNPCSVGSVRLPYRVTVDVRGERWVRIGIGIGLCVDLMCGYRPVSCADPDGIAIYINLTRVTGFPIGHARRVPRRHDGRCATSRTEHDARRQPHRARSDPGGPRDVRRGHRRGPRRITRRRSRSVISASIAQHTRNNNGTKLPHAMGAGAGRRAASARACAPSSAAFLTAAILNFRRLPPYIAILSDPAVCIKHRTSASCATPPCCPKRHDRQEPDSPCACPFFLRSDSHPPLPPEPAEHAF